MRDKPKEVVTPDQLVKEDKDGTLSYNCPKHGLDSGCICKESGYWDALEKARNRLASAAAPVLSAEDALTICCTVADLMEKDHSEAVRYLMSLLARPAAPKEQP